MLSLRWSVALAIAALALPASLEAQATLVNGFGGTANYGTECLGMNDDGSSNAIDLLPYFPSGLRFFDRTHTRVYVNTNGNISFSDPVPTFTAQPFPVADRPMIAPYWADVDIRPFDRVTGLMRRCFGPADGDTTLGAACHNPSENGVWWHIEEGRLVVTWDRVAYYQCHSDDDQKMSFQLVITAVDSGACGGGGDFDVEFRYNRCEWTTGDASRDGTDIPRDGFGGVEAQAGFDAGNEMDFVEIAGSRTPTIHTTLCNESNVGETGVWRFEIRSGEVFCPGAGDGCATGMMGVCATGRTQCVGDGIECRPEIEPSTELCDGQDNDCDGAIDEEVGASLCGDFEECREGSCVGICFEGSCPDGYTCVDRVLCVEEACLDVECPEGQRCEGGTCISPCDGVVCPHAQSCVAGQCLDLCADAVCEECTVCELGSCIPECALAGCAAGESCDPLGHCVGTACLGMECPAGHHCDAGSCVDSCAGAVCPGELVCIAGRCTDAPATDPDAGPAILDGGPVVPRLDLGPMDGGGAGIDGGRTLDGDDDGCGCRVVGRSERSGLWLFPLAALIFWRRRR